MNIILGIFVGLVVLAVVALLIWAWGVGLVWAWNITLVPFLGWPALSFWPAIGILFLISLIKGLFTINVNKTEK